MASGRRAGRVASRGSQTPSDDEEPSISNFLRPRLSSIDRAVKIVERRASWKSLVPEIEEEPAAAAAVPWKKKVLHLTNSLPTGLAPKDKDKDRDPPPLPASSSKITSTSVRWNSIKISREEAQSAKDSLAGVSLFNKCSPRFVEVLSQQVSRKIFEAGTEIFREGDYGDSMYILNRGEVEIIIGTTVVLTLHDGSVFGEMAAICKNPAVAKRTATVRAKTLCDCRIAHREALLQSLAIFKDDAAVLESEVERRLEDLRQKGKLKRAKEWWRLTNDPADVAFQQAQATSSAGTDPSDADLSLPLNKRGSLFAASVHRAVAARRASCAPSTNLPRLRLGSSDQPGDSPPASPGDSPPASPDGARRNTRRSIAARDPGGTAWGGPDSPDASPCGPRIKTLALRLMRDKHKPGPPPLQSISDESELCLGSGSATRQDLGSKSELEGLSIVMEEAVSIQPVDLKRDAPASSFGHASVADEELETESVAVGVIEIPHEGSRKEPVDSKLIPQEGRKNEQQQKAVHRFSCADITLAAPAGPDSDQDGKAEAVSSSPLQSDPDVTWQADSLDDADVDLTPKLLQSDSVCSLTSLSSSRCFSISPAASSLGYAELVDQTLASLILSSLSSLQEKLEPSHNSWGQEVAEGKGELEARADETSVTSVEFRGGEKEEEDEDEEEEVHKEEKKEEEDGKAEKEDEEVEAEKEEEEEEVQEREDEEWSSRRWVERQEDADDLDPQLQKEFAWLSSDVTPPLHAETPKGSAIFAGPSSSGEIQAEVLQDQFAAETAVWKFRMPAEVQKAGGGKNRPPEIRTAETSLLSPGGQSPDGSEGPHPAKMMSLADQKRMMAWCSVVAKPLALLSPPGTAGPNFSRTSTANSSSSTLGNPLFARGSSSRLGSAAAPQRSPLTSRLTRPDEHHPLSCGCPFLSPAALAKAEVASRRVARNSCRQVPCLDDGEVSISSFDSTSLSQRLNKPTVSARCRARDLQYSQAMQAREKFSLAQNSAYSLRLLQELSSHGSSTMLR